MNYIPAFGISILLAAATIAALEIIASVIFKIKNKK